MSTAALTARRVKVGVRHERGPMAVPLLAAVISLCAIGVVMVYSASSVRAYLTTANPGSQGIQQAIFAVVGLGAMFVASRIDVQLLRRVAIPIYMVTLLLLAVVLVPGIGTQVAGSRRWIVLPVLGGFQPAELAKLAVCLYLAHWLDRRGTEVRGLSSGLIPFALLVVPGFLLIALEPDLGTAVVFIAAAVSIFFMAGANLIYLGGITAAVAGAGYLMVTRTPYQLERVQSFFDPFRDPLGAGYNAVQGLMALALGGITGAGLGASRQKFFYLPAPSTDFIFAIIGEEWGLIGTLTVLGLFLVVAYHGYRIAIHATDTFSALLAAGITSWLIVQALINMMVVSALMPVTGIPLPFISYGGSALIINLVAVGILLSISRDTTQTGSIIDAVFGFGRRDRRARVPRTGRRAGAARRATRS
jgi:cell division protein FtsW